MQAKPIVKTATPTHPEFHHPGGDAMIFVPVAAMTKQLLKMQAQNILGPIFCQTS
jgi:hypothetical protein